jgi:hypothetical protein
MYLNILRELFDLQQNESQYPLETLELLSDSLSASVKANMAWFDPDASEMIKQAMQKAIDSSSSRKIKDDYSAITELL